MSDWMHEEAEKTLTTALARCLEALRSVDAGQLTADDATSEIYREVAYVHETIDDVLTTDRTSSDDLQPLLDRAQAELNHLADTIDRHPAMPAHAAAFVHSRSAVFASRASQADEVYRLATALAEWDEATASLAPPRVRAHALDLLDEAVGMDMAFTVLFRMSTASLQAHGPRQAVDMAGRYMTHHRANREYWSLTLHSMDFLAVWAAAASAEDELTEYQQRSIPALIEIAGYPELTLWAISRVPLHRLTVADQMEMAALLAGRHEVMGIDDFRNARVSGTRAVEVTYLRSLDLMDSTWPGADVGGG